MKQVTFQVRRKSNADHRSHLCPVGWWAPRLWMNWYLKSLFRYDGLYQVWVRVAPRAGTICISQKDKVGVNLKRWVGNSWKWFDWVCVPAMRRLPPNTPLTFWIQWLRD